MRSVDSAVQLSLFESNEIPWQSLPDELRLQLVEELAHLFKEEVESTRTAIEEEVKDA